MASDQLRHLEATVKDLNSRLQTSSDDLERLRGDLDRKERENINLLDENKDLKHQSNKRQHLLDNVKLECEKVHQLMKQKEKELCEMECTLNKSHANLADKDMSNTELRQQVDNQTRLLEAQRAELDEVKRRREVKEKEVAECSEKAQRLTEENTRLAEERKNAEIQRDNIREQMQQLRKKNGGMLCIKNVMISLLGDEIFKKLVKAVDL